MLLTRDETERLARDCETLIQEYNYTLDRISWAGEGYRRSSEWADHLDSAIRSIEAVLDDPGDETAMLRVEAARRLLCNQALRGAWARVRAIARDLADDCVELDDLPVTTSAGREIDPPAHATVGWLVEHLDPGEEVEIEIKHNLDIITVAREHVYVTAGVRLLEFDHPEFVGAEIAWSDLGTWEPQAIEDDPKDLALVD